MVFFGGYFFSEASNKQTVMACLNGSFYRSIAPDSLKKWESESFKESNSYIIHLRNYWNHTPNSYDYSSLYNCTKTDYFEAASLSKSMFALTSYRYAIPQIKDQKLKRYYLSLLQHSSGFENNSKCKFHYSDSGYLKAGVLYREIVGNSFENDVDQEFPFVWKPSFKGVDGFIRKDTFFRKIEKADTAFPNGSLYLNYNNAQLFSKLQFEWGSELVNQQNFSKLNRDYRIGNHPRINQNSNAVPICGFQNLSWLEGIGLDESLGRPILFQWGCNWCYNHILLIDVERGQSLIVLTNSIIGAHEIAQFTNKLYGQRLKLFDYIGWW